MQVQSKTIIQLFDPASASDKLWEKFFEFDKAIEKELYPADSYPSKAYVKKTMLVSSTYNRVIQWIAIDKSQNNKIIGFTKLFLTTKENPNYETTKNVAEGSISILPSYRRRGLGRKFFKILISNAKNENRTILQSFSGTESGKKFCIKLLGQPALESIENRLYINNINWSLLEDWKKECSIKAKGTKIELFQSVPDSDLEEFTNLYTQIANQQPLGELEGRSKITPQLRRKMEKKLRDIDIKWITMICRSSEGKISGFTDIQYSLDNPKEIRQIFTGIHLNYRGNKLGKLLKTEMTFFIKKQFPFAKYITTENANNNSPMLSINKRMGFKKQVQEIGFKWKIKDKFQNLDIQKANIININSLHQISLSLNVKN